MSFSWNEALLEFIFSLCILMLTPLFLYRLASEVKAECLISCALQGQAHVLSTTDTQGKERSSVRIRLIPWSSKSLESKGFEWFFPFYYYSSQFFYLLNMFSLLPFSRVSGFHAVVTELWTVQGSLQKPEKNVWLSNTFILVSEYSCTSPISNLKKSQRCRKYLNFPY